MSWSTIYLKKVYSASQNTWEVGLFSEKGSKTLGKTMDLRAPSEYLT